MIGIMDVILWLRDHYVVPMLIIFLLILAATYAPRQKPNMERHAMIPLRDDR